MFVDSVYGTDNLVLFVELPIDQSFLHPHKCFWELRFSCLV